MELIGLNQAAGMAYSEARRLIQNGDFIASRDSHGIVGALTQKFTSDPHTHTGIARWADDRLYMANLNSGRNHLTAVSQLRDFDVCDPPPGIDRDAIVQATDEWLAEPIEYGFLAFIGIGLQCALHLKLILHWRKIVVCSGGSVQILERGAHITRDRGLNPPPEWLEHNRQLSPGQLFAELPFKLAVRS